MLFLLYKLPNLKLAKTHYNYEVRGNVALDLGQPGSENPVLTQILQMILGSLEELS